jgi:hypothetical protein
MRDSRRVIHPNLKVIEVGCNGFQIHRQTRPDCHLGIHTQTDLHMVQRPIKSRGIGCYRDAIQKAPLLGFLPPQGGPITTAWMPPEVDVGHPVISHIHVEVAIVAQHSRERSRILIR